MRRIVWIVAVTVLVVSVTAAISTPILWPALGQSIWSLVYAYRWWIPAVMVAIAAILFGWLLAAFLRQPSGSTWRNNVLVAAKGIEHRLNTLPADGTPADPRLKSSVDRAVRDHLQAARNAATLTQPPPNFGYQIIDWWTGDSVEAAYLNLHEAEIALAQLLPEDEIQARIPETLARLQTMEVTDPRRRAAETELSSGIPGPRRRAAFQHAVRIGLELKDQQHDRIRGFRNIVLTATVGLMSLVVTLCLVGALKPDAIPLCFGPPPTTTAPGQPPAPIQGPAGTACPSEEAPPTPGTKPRRLPAPGDVSLVALVGLLGRRLHPPPAGLLNPLRHPGHALAAQAPLGRPFSDRRAATHPRRVRPRPVPARQPTPDPGLCLPVRHRPAAGHPAGRPPGPRRPGQAAK
jgi:hypothetical protein